MLYKVVWYGIVLVVKTHLSGDDVMAFVVIKKKFKNYLTTDVYGNHGLCRRTAGRHPVTSCLLDYHFCIEISVDVLKSSLLCVRCHVYWIVLRYVGRFNISVMTLAGIYRLSWQFYEFLHDGRVNLFKF